MAGSAHPSQIAADETERKRLENERAAKAKALAAALICAAEAEPEAAIAATEHAAAAARVRAALDRAAKERAAADPDADADADADGASSISEGVRSSVHAAMVFQEATVVLNLHAQAAAIQNIRNLVPIVLDVAASNFTRWREQFLLSLGKYSLQGHVLHDAAAPD
jgi:hypothetical protein